MDRIGVYATAATWLSWDVRSNLPDWHTDTATSLKVARAITMA